MIVNSPEEQVVNEGYKLEEIELEEYRDYEELMKLICYYKHRKIDKEFFKERLFVIGIRNLSDEVIDEISNETQFIRDGAISIFGIIRFMKRIIEAGSPNRFLSIVNGPSIGLMHVLPVEVVPFFFQPREYSEMERDVYSNLINRLLQGDIDCGQRLPIVPNSDDLYEKLKDGIILAKLINLVQPNCINIETLNKNLDMTIYDKFDNLNKVLVGAKTIGIDVDSLPDCFIKSRKNFINDILGYLLLKINLPKETILINPETEKLCNPGETINDIAELPRDEFLRRWTNYHLRNQQIQELNNFGQFNDNYYPLILHDIFPNFETNVLQENDVNNRAKIIIENAKNFGVETTLTPDVFLQNNQPLNYLFLGDIYNADAYKNGGTFDANLANIYAKTINEILPDANIVIPEDANFYTQLGDGIILSQLESLINNQVIQPEALRIGENISNEDKLYNLNVVLNAGKSLGIPMALSNVDITRYRNKEYENMIGDIIERINVKPDLILRDPDSQNLLKPGEKLEDLSTLPADQFLIRWVNQRLSVLGYPAITNLGEDLRDGIVYNILLNDIAPAYCEKIPFDQNHPINMERLLRNIKNLGVDTYVTADDLAQGNERIGRLVLSEIYNAHTSPYNVNEKECYTKIINHILDEDEELKGVIPINPGTNEIFRKLKNGVILAKLINIACLGTVDERVVITSNDMNMNDQLSNLNLVINSAKSIGIFVDITVNDILNENKACVIELVSQILRQIIFKRISVQEFPQIIRLVQPHEEIGDILRLGPDDILKRWVNYHMSQLQIKERLKSFSEDLKDSKIYALLLRKLNPKVDISFMNNQNLYIRAQRLLKEVPKIGANVYLKYSDIVSGNANLNKFFLAELFLSCIGLSDPTDEEIKKANTLMDDDEEVGREERTFRTWVNSLKLDSGRVNNLCEESKSAVLLLKIIDKIQPGVVKWDIVDVNTKNPFKIGVNCQEVIESSKRSGLKVVSIGNKDIQEGKRKHILALVWQLMRTQTLKVIGEKNEDDLIAWANSLISPQRRVHSLKEKKLSDGLFWIELLNAIRPDCIRWEYVIIENITEKDKEMNAKYALSVARILGAVIFIVWEDITEVRSKLLLTFLASLYDLASKNISN